MLPHSTAVRALLPHLHGHMGLVHLEKGVARGPRWAGNPQAGRELTKGAIRGQEPILERMLWKGKGTQDRGAESWE